MLIVSRSSCNQCSTFILLKFGFSCVVHVIGMYHLKLVGVDLRFLRRKRCCCNVTTPFLMATLTTGNPGCSVHVVMIGATDTLYGGFWRLISVCSASHRFSGFATLASLLLQKIQINGIVIEEYFIILKRLIFEYTGWIKVYVSVKYQIFNFNNFLILNSKLN